MPRPARQSATITVSTRTVERANSKVYRMKTLSSSSLSSLLLWRRRRRRRVAFLLQIILLVCSNCCYCYCCATTKATTLGTLGFLVVSSSGYPLFFQKQKRIRDLRFYTGMAKDDSEKVSSTTGAPTTARSTATATTTTTSKTTSIRPRRTTKRRQKAKWDDMIERLRTYYNHKGHSFVPKEYTDKELYQWTLSVRQNYKHQWHQERRHHHRHHHHDDTGDVQLQLQWNEEEELSSSTTTRRNHNTVVHLSTPRTSTRSRNTTTTTTTTTAVAASAAVTTKTNQNRPRLAADKLQQLQELEFPWDLQKTKWDQRYRDLQAFQKRVGHCRVPANFVGGLGIWVRNQRREYQRLQRGEPSTLYPERLQALQALGFEWYKSREEMWDKRYQELVVFLKEHGHSNVPEDYADNVSLGQWCMNQRTAYRRYCLDQPTAMNQERAEKLEALGFVWKYRQQQWNDMRERLKQYYDENGHVNIATTDHENNDLRVWLIFQRFHYNRRRAGFKTPLTKQRIKALEEDIPNFSWRGREGNSGPKTEDWAKLFEAMRDRGIAPGARPKQHWFEGINPFTIQVKDTYTEEDLLELWNQQDDDDDDDDDID